MSTVEKSIRLYAWKTNYHTFRIVQGEMDSRRFNIQLFSTTIPVTLHDCHVCFYAVKPNGKKAYLECEILDADTGLVSVELSAQVCAVDGTVDCWIQVVSDAGTDLRFEGMNIEVSECDLNEAAESSNDFGFLTTAIAEMRPATARANEAAERANASADNADRATAESDAQTSKAKTATTNAEKATTAANTAKSNADKATASANRATTAAEQAKSNADAAAQAAINAANAANTAKTNADKATSSANTAAKTANDAASAANTARQAIDGAVVEAQTAVSNANKAVQAANSVVQGATDAAKKANSAAVAALIAASKAEEAAYEANDALDLALAQSEQLVAQELAKRGQLKPEFANDVSECADESKLYVLPDGMIWAYMKQVVAIPGGEVTNSINLTKGLRISAQTGDDRTQSNCCATDWIDISNIPRPCRILLTGVRWSSTDSRTLYHPHVAFAAKDAEGNILGSSYSGPGLNWVSFTNNDTEKFLDVVAVIDSPQVASVRFSGTWGTSANNGQTGYGSFNAANAVLSYNMPGTEEIIEGWHSTGHSIVPSDNEERIKDVEDDVNDLEKNVVELQQNMDSVMSQLRDDSGDPDYVRTEAERVAENLLVTNHDFSFALVSDLHSPTNDVGLMHGGQALRIIAETQPIDAVVVAGDLIDNWSFRTIEQARASISSCRKCFTNDRTPTFWVKGNHDCNGYPDHRLTGEELYNRTSKQQRNIFGVVENDNDPFGGYGYKDYEGAKVRLVFVNTSDNASFSPTAPSVSGNVGPIINAHTISATQLQWIADYALNFSDKEDASQWTLVFASHIPIYSVYSADYPNAYNFGTYTDAQGVSHERNVMNLADMVKAYVDKRSYSVTVDKQPMAKDFSALAKTANVAGFFCGHLHALKSFEYNGFKFISSPPACNSDKVSEDGNTYSKRAGTARDTAFNVFAIDTRTRKIYAYIYGAGYDREFTY